MRFKAIKKTSHSFQSVINIVDANVETHFLANIVTAVLRQNKATAAQRSAYREQV